MISRSPVLPVALAAGQQVAELGLEVIGADGAFGGGEHVVAGLGEDRVPAVAEEARRPRPSRCRVRAGAAGRRRPR